VSKKIDIPIEVLKKLYIAEGLSSRRMGKILGLAYSTVDRKIREFGFPIKTLAAAHIKTHRKKFDGDLQEMAYLIGFRTGDLRARKFYPNSETIKIDCGSTRTDQIDHIKELFNKYGHIWISKPTKLNKVQIECFVDLSFDFLLKKYKSFPKFITTSQTSFMSCLAGFIDAEGCFMTPTKITRVVFTLGNYELKLLRQIKQRLERLGISVKIYLGSRKGRIGTEGYRQKNDYWHLNIHRKADLLNFIYLIKPYLRYKRKIDDADMVKNILEERLEKLKSTKMVKFTHG